MSRFQRRLVAVATLGGLLSLAYAIHSTDLWLCPEGPGTLAERLYAGMECDVFNRAGFLSNFAVAFGVTGLLVTLLLLVGWVNNRSR